MNCPICHHSGRSVLTTEAGTDVALCSNRRCRHFWALDLTAGHGVHDWTTTVDLTSDQSLSLYRERNLRLLDRFLQLMPERPIRCLDFGAGDAHVSRTFKETMGDRIQITCIEADERCWRHYPAWGLDVCTELDDLAGQFDLIYLIEVIEHLDDPLQVLIALRSRLAPGGFMFISTPEGSQVESSTDAYRNPTHVHFFSRNSLNLLLNKAGFTKLEKTFVPELFPDYPTTRASHIKRYLKHRVKRVIGWPEHITGFTRQNQ